MKEVRLEIFMVVPIGCYEHGKLLPVLSCNYEINIFDSVQYLGEGEKLIRGSLRGSPPAAFLGQVNSLFGAQRPGMLLHTEGPPPNSHSRWMIFILVLKIGGLS